VDKELAISSKRAPAIGWKHSDFWVELVQLYMDSRRKNPAKKKQVAGDGDAGDGDACAVSGDGDACAVSGDGDAGDGDACAVSGDGDACAVSGDGDAYPPTAVAPLVHVDPACIEMMLEGIEMQMKIASDKATGVLRYRRV
jgi:hypothetical protein